MNATRMYFMELDTDFHKGISEYDWEFDLTREYNVGYFITSEQSTIIIGELGPLKAYLNATGVTCYEDEIQELFVRS